MLSWILSLTIYCLVTSAVSSAAISAPTDNESVADPLHFSPWQVQAQVVIPSAVTSVQLSESSPATEQDRVTTKLQTTVLGM